MPLKPAVSDKDHLEGPKDAELQVVEYGDYECPHCGRAYYIMKKLQEIFEGRINLVFRNFPLEKIHPNAKPAAIATEAAARQDKYWQMHDVCFEKQESLDEEDLLRYAVEIGLDIDQYKKDITDPALAQKVEDDFESGIRSGVNATPTFFLNGEKYNNGWESDRMERFIRENILR